MANALKVLREAVLLLTIEQEAAISNAHDAALESEDWLTQAILSKRLEKICHLRGQIETNPSWPNSGEPEAEVPVTKSTGIDYSFIRESDVNVDEEICTVCFQDIGHPLFDGCKHADCPHRFPIK